MMSPNEIVEAVAGELGATSMTQLTGGHGASDNVRIEVGGRAYVMKVRRDRSRLEHRVVARVSKVLHLRSIPHGGVVWGPALVMGHSVIVLEFMVGRPMPDAIDGLSEDAATTAGRELAHWLDRVHELELPSNWEAKATKLFLSRLAKVAALLPDDVRLATERTWNEVRPALRDVRLALVHRDLDSSNIIIDGDRFGGVIDLEQCRMLDPLYDLIKLRDYVFPLSQSFANGFLGATRAPLDGSSGSSRLAACAILEYLAAIRYFSVKAVDGTKRDERIARLASVVAGSKSTFLSATPAVL